MSDQDLDDIRKRYSSWEAAPASSTAPDVGSDLDDIRKRHSMWKQPRPAKKAAEAPPPVPELSDKDFEGSTLQLGFPPLTGSLDTGIKISPVEARNQAEIGSGFADAIQGARQLLGKETKADVDAKRRLDAPLLATGRGKVNNFLGNVLPWMAVPMGATRGVAGETFGPLLENTAIGAAQGAAAPVGTGEDRTRNAIAGGAASGALSLAPAMARGTVAKISPEKRALVDEARARGMPLSLTDVSDAGWLKSLRAITDESWLPGLSSKGQERGKQEAFNRMVGEAWGTPRSSHTPEQLRADRKRIGSAVEGAWGQADIPFQGGAGGLEAQLAKRRADAAEFGTGPGTVGRQVDVNIRRGLEDQLTQPMGPGQGTVLPGENAFATQKGWRGYEKTSGLDSTNETAKIMADARRDVIQAYRQQLNPEQRADFDKLRGEYKALMAMNSISKKNASGRAGRDVGDVRPTDVSEAVERGYPDAADISPFGNTPRIGQEFLVNRVGQTGGSQKAAMQNVGVLSALGAAGLLGGTASLPFLAGAYGTALAGTRALNSPRVLDALLNNPYRKGAPAMEKLLATAPNRAAGQGALSAINYYTPRVEVRGTSADKDEDE